MAKFVEGQAVMLTGRGGPEVATVRKVGRVYVFASRDPQSTLWRKFRLSTGLEDSNIGGGGRIWTLEEWEAHSLRGEALAELKRLGLELVRYREGDPIPTEQLQRIVAILKEGF